MCIRDRYVAELRSILVACGISDGKMEEGSMRVDANISVRPTGTDELRTRCEIKNVNSLRSPGRAIEYAARRPADLHASGDRVVQETRHWDESDGRTHTMRSKEEADDYRYFPEPDLVPVDIGAERVAEIAAGLPLLPAARRHRLAEVTGEDHTAESVVVAVERGQDDQALAAMALAAGADPDAVEAAITSGHEAGTGAGSGLDLAAVAGSASDALRSRALVHVVQNLAVDGGAALAPGRLAELIQMETGGDLTATQAKQVLAELVADPSATAASVAEAKGFEAMDTGALEGVIDQVIGDNPDEWTQFCEGDAKVQGKLTGFFIGKVMKATKGQADGKAATALLRSKLP